jgi:hypothetical protein
VQQQHPAEEERMADQSEAMGWIGKTVVDRDGGEVGPCTTVLFDDTGAPEWIGVDHAGVRRKLTAAGATTENGRVRVELTRAQVVEAPRLAETPPTPEHRAAGREKQVMGALGALGGLVVAFLTLRWLKARRQPTTSERLLETAREAAAKAAHGGATVLDRTVAVAAPAAVAAGRVATKEGKRAGKVAAEKSRSAGKAAGKVAAEKSRTAGKAAGKVAAEQGKRAGGVAAALAATAAEEVGSILESGAEVGHRVGDTLGAAPDALAEGGKRIRRKWRRLTNRIVMLVALGAGYVAGSAAGRQRYEQIKRTAEKVGAMATSGSH